jgi:hypothetical protein
VIKIKLNNDTQVFGTFYVNGYHLLYALLLPNPANPIMLAISSSSPAAASSFSSGAFSAAFDVLVSFLAFFLSFFLRFASSSARCLASIRASRSEILCQSLIWLHTT